MSAFAFAFAGRLWRDGVVRPLRSGRTCGLSCMLLLPLFVLEVVPFGCAGPTMCGRV